MKAFFGTGAVLTLVFSLAAFACGGGAEPSSESEATETNGSALTPASLCLPRSCGRIPLCPDNAVAQCSVSGKTCAWTCAKPDAGSAL